MSPRLHPHSRHHHCPNADSPPGARIQATVRSAAMLHLAPPTLTAAEQKTILRVTA
jgi:hypothetical protein